MREGERGGDVEEERKESGFKRIEECEGWREEENWKNEPMGLEGGLEWKK